MRKLDDQPEWTKDIIGLDYYGIEITDAYLAKGAKRPIGFDDETVVVLEHTAKRICKGYWYYHPNYENWYWSGGSCKKVFKKALDEYIKPNFNGKFD